MPPPDLPADFFTLESFLTLGSAVAAVWVVANTVRRILGIESLWIGFATSIAVVALGAYSADRLSTIPQFALAFVNACLLFCTAFGVNESFMVLSGKRATGVTRATDNTTRKQKPWLVSWHET